MFIKEHSMQTYSNPSSRNEKVAADMGNGAKPGMVNVPMPGTNSTQSTAHAGVKPSVPGFTGGGIKPGKI